ncbi:LOB domain-containing protein 6 [Hibiscus syriacus]|uniref:LOB domain-containing protein 6 n=1 Tax=Hibiscus syriacus TaxID=106335 RepID=A0A6A3AN16_HIBSY|nr:LOB domain-containing protein 36-like [Hibiscus syriacus]XP_038999979.1 LOB domain-containing protein 36-like [Hibiscus syriacus]KAE8704807.1 LOB domain-containing protein 6 [Hibiscus syriacus]
MSSSNSPCAACKFLRRKCTQECVFAPYFPPDNPQKFQNVHKVFGASNVAKLLNEVNPSQREDAVNSLAYEAEARLRDPVYGCVGLISILQHRLKQMQHDLTNAKKELATYIGPQALLPILQPPVVLQQPQHVGNPSSMMQQSVMPMMGIPTAASASQGGQLVIREPQQQQQQQQQPQQQMFEAQQQLAAVVAAREQQDFLRGYEQQQHQGHQQEIVTLNSGFEGGDGSVTATGFNRITTATTMSPSLALGSFDNPYQIQTQQQDHHPLQPQLLIQTQQVQPLQQNQQLQISESEEGTSSGPC